MYILKIIQINIHINLVYEILQYYWAYFITFDTQNLQDNMKKKICCNLWGLYIFTLTINV